MRDLQAPQGGAQHQANAVLPGPRVDLGHVHGRQHGIPSLDQPATIAMVDVRGVIEAKDPLRRGANPVLGHHQGIGWLALLGQPQDPEPELAQEGN